jgi:hypothetical protein
VTLSQDKAVSGNNDPRAPELAPPDRNGAGRNFACDRFELLVKRMWIGYVSGWDVGLRACE